MMIPVFEHEMLALLCQEHRYESRVASQLEQFKAPGLVQP